MKLPTLLRSAAFISALWCLAAGAQNSAPEQQKPPEQPRQWLISELAAAVDVVALAQVVQTNYRYRRGFPISGFADLSVLIPYKMSSKTDELRVRESGLKQDGCYFPQTFLGEEGPRYLVFLATHEEDGSYRGHPMGCMLAVLVTSDNAYALRYPSDSNNIRLTEQQRTWIEKMDFSDPAAFAGSPEMTPGRKQDLAERIQGEVHERGVKYTLGIHSRHFLDLLGRENLQRPDSGSRNQATIR